MVDVGDKSETRREAIASGRVHLSAEALRAVTEGSAKKGDVRGVARIAGIQAAKRTSDWIPLCHPLAIESVELVFACDETAGHIDIRSTVRLTGRTGVEMEALVAVSAAALTIYDMCKSMDRGMVIDAVQLVRKSGGKSGVYDRAEQTENQDTA